MPGRKEALHQRGPLPRELAGDPDPRSGQALAKAVSDKDWSVRAAAIEAIAKRAQLCLWTSFLQCQTGKMLSESKAWGQIGKERNL